MKESNYEPGRVMNKYQERQPQTTRNAATITCGGGVDDDNNNNNSATSPTTTTTCYNGKANADAQKHQQPHGTRTAATTTATTTSDDNSCYSTTTTTMPTTATATQRRQHNNNNNNRRTAPLSTHFITGSVVRMLILITLFAASASGFHAKATAVGVNLLGPRAFSSLRQEAPPKDTSFSWQNQWFPVLPLSYLNESEDREKPVAITVLGRPLVIWKNEADSWSIFEDVCPHRRSPLSTGQVVGNCLKCRYHGWEFAADGQVTSIPMKTTQTERQIPHRATSFPARCDGGLLWVHLGDASNNEIPGIPPEAVPSSEETQDADWMFNLNPISYTSMMENTFDPAHAPFTHESMQGFAGMNFSPQDTVPMEKYEVIRNATASGFTLQHSPYQLSTAQVAGYNSTTTRAFIPPSTVAVSSLPFFKTKMWFVPSTPYNTNVLSYFTTPKTKFMKWTRRFPRLQRFLKDTSHTRTYIGDWNYRFLSQDRITMQGQDQRKVGKVWRDATPTPSDFGVATFQNWVQEIAAGGPFPPTSPSSSQDFSRELSMWESHGKFCPRCQRSMRRLSVLHRTSANWSRISLVASALAATASGLTCVLMSRPVATRILTILSLQLMVVSFSARAVFDWCQQQHNRMYRTGPLVWQPQNAIFGYSKDKNQIF